MIVNIITKLGAKQYVITHGFGFSNVNVVINAEPIRFNISLEATLQITQPTFIVAPPIRLDFTLRGTPVIIPGNIIHAEPIKLIFRLNGVIIGADIFILDLQAQLDLQPLLEASINSRLSFLTNVELEEEVMRVRIT